MESSPPSNNVAPNHGYFFIEGEYFQASDGQLMGNQMYVEFFHPAQVAHPFPVIMIHGAGQTGTNFTGTPDGREGWAQFFVSRGYSVYVVDQPARGRSAYFEEVHGKTRRFTASRIAEHFTAPEHYNLWPQAKLHTQWPGTGEVGDPIFDQFFASQVPMIADRALTQQLVQTAGAALLDRLGPSILLTHSQSGSFGWLIADARPSKVKAIVAVEPSDLVRQRLYVGPPDWFENGDLTAPWGLAAIPLTYDPQPADVADMQFIQQDVPDGPGLTRCWRQAEPARQLVNLRDIPVVIVTSEAGYAAAGDHGTSAYLAQAGVPNTHLRLADMGIRGNGHMMMLEKNNLEVAAAITDWLDAHVTAGPLL